MTTANENFNRNVQAFVVRFGAERNPDEGPIIENLRRFLFQWAEVEQREPDMLVYCETQAALDMMQRWDLSNERAFFDALNGITMPTLATLAEC